MGEAISGACWFCYSEQTHDTGWGYSTKHKIYFHNDCLVKAYKNNEQVALDVAVDMGPDIMKTLLSYKI